MNKLIDRHAYTVTGMCQVKGGRKRRLVIPLVRLRDPHGAGTKAEWEGDWSDDSQLWKEISSRATNQLRRREKDGEFYVSFYKDFLRYFDDIDVIHINPLRIDLNEDRQTREFALAEWNSEWRTGIGANRGTGYQDFHRNPQFNFTISNCRDRNPTCTIVVSLTQELDNRKQNKSSIGFKIYKSRPSGEDLDGDYVKNSYNLQCDSGAFTNSRDVTGSFLLPAGSYTIIPGTFDTQDFGGFFLRLFVDNRWWCETSVPLKSVTDYSATARNAAWWKSLWRTLLHCRCCCYCCCPTVQVCSCCCQHSGTNSDDEPYSSK